ncbi:MAG: hydantoinase B/oxoprolinase family protein, partial [Candidatus Tectomicrobia bacterium]|nr:hydantoinase B/oxoprolinase family protein [Candidatus Tectomicrobia bacterium]
TLPHNSGAFEHVHFKLREGSIAGIPRFPTGTSVATTFTADRLASCTIALMAKVDPHQGGAEGGYVSWNYPVLSGEDPRYGHAPYVNQMILAEGAGGGGPAVKGYDGWLTWGIGAVMGGLWSTSAELWEKAQPQLIECGEIVPDSGGAGEYCGSPGVRIVVRARQAPFIAAGFGDGQVFPPQGILDGEPGGPNQGFILDERGERIQELPLIGLFEIRAGHALEGITNGGGGFGDPLDRDPERVRQDVRKGWVSVEKARETFGVVLDLEPEELAVDCEATRKLREEKKRLKKRTPAAT